MFERVGGESFFRRLVAEFYAGVPDDAVLAPLYPEAPDFSGAQHRLTLFLVQYWGGPSTYSEERGDPQLRMRHMPFTVGPVQRDRWLARMTAAVGVATRELADHGTPADEVEAIAGELLGYFRPTAEHLRNDTGLPITSAGFRA